MTARIAGPESQATFDVIMRTLSEPAPFAGFRSPSNLDPFLRSPGSGWLSPMLE